MAAFMLTAATQAPHGVATLAGSHPMGPFLSLGLGLLALGFTRLSALEAVESPLRRALLEIFSTGRCYAASDLARLAGVSRKTAVYHLHVLERTGLIVRRYDRSKPLFAAAGKPPDPASRLLEHPNRRALWDAAAAAPGSTGPELARAVGLKGGTGHFHLRVLAEAGLLEVVQYGDQRGYVVARPLAGDDEAKPLEA